MDEQTNGRPSAGSVITARDRRRPGRVRTGNPWLIRMMRGEVELQTDGEPRLAEGAATDDLAAVKGIMLGAAIGLASWLVLAFLVWHFLL